MQNFGCATPEMFGGSATTRNSFAARAVEADRDDTGTRGAGRVRPHQPLVWREEIRKLATTLCLGASSYGNSTSCATDERGFRT